MIGHYGATATTPCHYCDVKQKDLGNHTVNVSEQKRDFVQTFNTMLDVNKLHSKGKKTDAGQLEKTISIRCKDGLPPIWWIPHFDPLLQTPLCWMHNHPLGILKRILRSFAAIYRERKFNDRTNPPISFIEGINAKVKNYPSFPGIQSLPKGIFVQNSSEPTFCYLNADQFISFLRMSPTFMHKFLDQPEFDFWMLYVNLCLKVCQKSFNEDSLDELHGLAVRFVREYSRLFGQHVKSKEDDDKRQLGISTNFWNLHANLHVVQWIYLLGPIWLYNTGLGERHHVLQKLFAQETNRKHKTMDRDVYSSNKRLMAYYWMCAEGSSENDGTKARELKEPKKDHSFSAKKKATYEMPISSLRLQQLEQSLGVKLTAQMIDAPLLNGFVHNSMWLRGHWVRPGMDVQLENSHERGTLQLAEIVQFIGVGAKLAGNVNTYVNLVVIRRYLPATYLPSHVLNTPKVSECPLLLRSTELEVVPSSLCIRRAQVLPREANRDEPYFIYNPWTTEEVFRAC
jgi:hypothetical protein